MPKYGAIKFRASELKSFEEKFKGIKTEILLKYGLFSDLADKDLTIFLFILKNYGSRIAYNIKYVKKLNKKYNINKNLQKKFFTKQISLLFMFLYCKDKSKNIKTEPDIIKYELRFKNIYKDLFSLIDNIYYSAKSNNNKNIKSIFDIDDIFQIIQLNLLLGLNDLLNKNYIFNESIKYLTKIYLQNGENENINNYLKLIMLQLYANLSKTPKNLNFLKRDKDLYNFSILEITNFLICPKIDVNLNGLIMETLNLIYKYNYSSYISDYILNKIKECFYELKPNNIKNIIKCIKNLNALMQFLINLFDEEENEKFDLYQPSSYFIFGGNEESGIKCSPNTDLFKKNFTLIFSFKINEMVDDIIYPLITYATLGNKNEIIINISIYNKKLRFYTQAEEKLREIADVYTNTSYLVIFEFKLSGILKDKLIVHINNKKNKFYLNNLNNKSK